MLPAGLRNVPALDAFLHDLRFAREAQQAVAMLARFRQDQKAPQHSHAKPVTPLSDISRD